jgi:hypothetical protein
MAYLKSRQFGSEKQNMKIRKGIKGKERGEEGERKKDI